MYCEHIFNSHIICNYHKQKSPVEGWGTLRPLTESFWPLCWLMKTVTNSVQFSTRYTNYKYYRATQLSMRWSDHYFTRNIYVETFFYVSILCFFFWKMGGLRWVRCYYNVVGKWCWNNDKILSMTCVANDKIIFPAILGKNININLSLSTKSRRYVCS